MLASRCGGLVESRHIPNISLLMLLKNSDLIMQNLRANDVVLDIGGWAHPFNRANYVMDAEPYETRGYYNQTFARLNPIPPLGGTQEFFTRDTWIQRDICKKDPYPFQDKEIDFVICSHTLEDIRDPLWVCFEMTRIAKAGYVELPSRVWETCRGLEPSIAGLSHHRWLTEIKGNTITFIQKFHRIHQWRYSLPKSTLASLSAESSVQWLFWSDSFQFVEVSLHGEAQLGELESFVNSVRPYPRWLVWLDEHLRETATFPARALRKMHRLVNSRE